MKWSFYNFCYRGLYLHHWGKWILKWIHHDGKCVCVAEGRIPVLDVYQTFQENPMSAFSSIPDDEASSLAMRLDRVFIPIQVQTVPPSL